jgi:hypothetical protein
MNERVKIIADASSESDLVAQSPVILHVKSKSILDGKAVSKAA